MKDPECEKDMLKEFFSGKVQMNEEIQDILNRRVREVAYGIERQKHGAEIANRQKYLSWVFESPKRIKITVDDSFMGDMIQHELVFHIRHLLK